LSEFFSFFESLTVVRGILSFILVFIIPGFAWTLVFFRQVNVLERIALSFGLSIAVVTLSIFVLNQLFGIRITGLNSVLIITVITVVPIAVDYLNRLRRRH
jgi:uncharacterized membrane protein